MQVYMATNPPKENRFSYGKSRKADQIIETKKLNGLIEKMASELTKEEREELDIIWEQLSTTAKAKKSKKEPDNKEFIISIILAAIGASEAANQINTITEKHNIDINNPSTRDILQAQNMDAARVH
jgi:hypothetical protein